MNIMKPMKRARLEAKGWKVGSAAEFLNLSPEESAYVDLKLALSRSLQRQRRKRGMTQHQLARLLKSSQSRVAKMEAGDASVSLDLIVRSLLALGFSKSSLLRTLPH
ncbi:MAG: helix-turn-helix transcriptional regulator [Acidobacteriota bacterium]